MNHGSPAHKQCRRKREYISLQSKWASSVFTCHQTIDDIHFVSWYFNTAISHKRRRKIQISVDHHREQTGDEPEDTGDAPSDRLQREERAEQVRSALNSLNEQHRAILVLREMEGCCYDTISEILDLPIGTVRSRLHRARSQLRCEMQPFMQEVPQTNVEPID